MCRYSTFQPISKHFDLTPKGVDAKPFFIQAGKQLQLPTGSRVELQSRHHLEGFAVLVLVWGKQC